MQIEKTQNIGRMVSLKGIKGLLKKLIGERPNAEQLRLPFSKVFRMFAEGLKILKTLLVKDDFVARFFTLVILGPPFMFVFMVLPILKIMNFFIPGVAVNTSFSWLDLLGGLLVASLMWAGVMSVRVFIKWRFCR